MSTTLKETLLQAAEILESNAIFIQLAAECRRHAGLNYVEVECPDFERTSENLITPELRAAIEGSKP